MLQKPLVPQDNHGVIAPPGLMTRLVIYAGKRKLQRYLAVALGVASIASAIMTYASITSSSPTGPDPSSVLSLVLINFILLSALIAVVSRSAFSLWTSLRKGSVGSRLQTRIVAMFSLVTILPTITVSVFSAMFFNYGIQSWFDTRVSTGLEESLAVAEAYLDEHKEIIRADAIAMANDLNRELQGAVTNPTAFSNLINGQVALRSLTEAVVIHGDKVIARSRLSFSIAFERLPQDAIERASHGEVAVLTDDDDRVRALIALDNMPDTFLMVGRLIDSRVINHMENAQGAVSEYRRLKSEISKNQINFSIIFVFLALMLLLAAVWYGMFFAGKLVVPISRLIKAAERVRAGDFSTKVQEGAENDEIATLGRAFNRMTNQLENQRKELIAANRQLDERRRFSEAVLAGVSAGVIALNQHKIITLYNRSALSLLNLSTEEVAQGIRMTDILPQITDLLTEAEMKPDKLLQQQVNLTQGEKVLILLVRITVERFKEEIEGFIVTFDDISELIVAQRNAAWADVARRVAHEIKNPLTPIQLSAERLRKKYAEQTSDVENFNKYTDTITRHVRDIGKMVDEFVSFARMPAPVFKMDDLCNILRKSMFSEQVAHADIAYTLTLPDTPLMLECDEAQLNQVFSNILKNAAESIEVRVKNAPQPQGKIDIKAFMTENRTIVEIRDNGTGFPADRIQQMMTPYVTTRSRGTGLGLAIVKKTMEDHKGAIQLENQASGGACITLTFMR